jgi:hypothetical protein
MEPWAELHVVGSAAELAVERLSGGDLAAVVTVAHEDPLEE